MKLLKQSDTVAIAFGLCIVLFFTTCKKYPEDKFISLRKPEKRAIGDWKIREYVFNSSSIINDLNYRLQKFDIRNLILSITGKGGKILPKYYFAPNIVGYGSDVPMSDKTKFRFTHQEGSNNFGDSIQKLLFFTPQSFKGANYTNWDIRNLYQNKMHLQLKTDSGNYDIYFEK